MKSRYPDLVCPKCGSNKFKFPKTSSDAVQCGDCGHEFATLDTLEEKIVAKAKSAETRVQRTRRHASEVADSHDKMRANVAETDRLIIQSNETLTRHRRENEEDP